MNIYRKCTVISEKIIVAQEYIQYTTTKFS
jgi:hypothetical protein